MTREEIIECYSKAVIGAGLAAAAGDEDAMREYELLKAGFDALRGPTREQVEKMRGEWIIEDAGDGDRRKKCSLCDTPISGWWGRDRFCANCGSPMTDEAVDMVMERLEGVG